MDLDKLNKKLQLYYIKGFRKPMYKGLYINSEKMIRNAKIVQNIYYAICLSKSLDKLLKDTNIPILDTLGLHDILHHKFYQHIIDDIILMSAFEMYAKATLLKKQYIVQIINVPSQYKKEQRNKPIHVKKLLSEKSKGIIWKLSDNTLSVSILLKDAYFEKITKRKSLQKTLMEINKRRNLLHFNIASSYSLKTTMLQDLEYLIKLIKKSV